MFRWERIMVLLAAHCNHEPTEHGEQTYSHLSFFMWHVWSRKKWSQPVSLSLDDYQGGVSLFSVLKTGSTARCLPTSSSLSANVKHTLLIILMLCCHVVFNLMYFPTRQFKFHHISTKQEKKHITWVIIINILLGRRKPSVISITIVLLYIM